MEIGRGELSWRVPRGIRVPLRTTNPSPQNGAVVSAPPLYRGSAQDRLDPLEQHRAQGRHSRGCAGSRPISHPWAHPSVSPWIIRGCSRIAQAPPPAAVHPRSVGVPTRNVRARYPRRVVLRRPMLHAHDANASRSVPCAATATPAPPPPSLDYPEGGVGAAVVTVP